MKAGLRAGEILSALADLFFPRYCSGCGDVYPQAPLPLCPVCFAGLAKTGFVSEADNEFERRLRGKFPFERAASLYFMPGKSALRELLHDLKYRRKKEYGLCLGRLAGCELKVHEAFPKAEIVVPVPIHPEKLKLRGYNQSEVIATGLCEETGQLLLADAILKRRATESQTRKNREERAENMEEVFARGPSWERLQGKQVLLLDDVMTTGATLTACADVLREIPGIRLSVFTIAVAE